MDVKNILVAGNYEKEFNKQLPGEVSKDFRFVPVDNITGDDLSWADVYVGAWPSPNFTFGNIKWVHTFNAGVNNFLEIDGWKEREVLLTRTVCSFGQKISEYCLSYILRDLQYHQEFQQKQREKKWEPKTPKMIKDYTFVIFGTGDIGQEVAKTFKQFGAAVYGVSRDGKQKEHFKEIVDITYAKSFVLKGDYIISTLPLTKETNKLFDSHFFENLNGTVFINVGRGATVDEGALIHSLDNGKLRFAVLDVLTEEPLPENSALWGRDDIIITPHISAVTDLHEAIACFFDTLIKVENNENLHNQVDFYKGY
jgi:phosphoglycerate dehydrogenase-like enzyme